MVHAIPPDVCKSNTRWKNCSPSHVVDANVLAGRHGVNYMITCGDFRGLLLLGDHRDCGVWHIKASEQAMRTGPGSMLSCCQSLSPCESRIGLACISCPLTCLYKLLSGGSWRRTVLLRRCPANYPCVRTRL